jgi:hypothetical protein
MATPQGMGLFSKRAKADAQEQRCENRQMARGKNWGRESEVV